MLKQFLFKPFVVPLLEHVLRLTDRCGLLFLLICNKSTIKAITGLDHLSTGKVVIFACFPDERLADHHINTLDEFAEQGYSIVVVSNHSRPQVIFRDVHRDWCFIHRRAYGRDFGCYKDALLMLYSHHDADRLAIERVVLLNDSVVLLRGARDSLTAHLTDERKNFAAVTENYHPSQHVGSFSLSFSSEVFLHTKVRRFWRKYVPISTRRYSIKKGEIGFSRVVRKAGFVPHVQFPLSQQKLLLCSQDIKKVVEVANLMEPHFRASMAHPFDIVDRFVARLLNPVHWLMNRRQRVTRRASVDRLDPRLQAASTIPESLITGALLTGPHTDYEAKLSSLTRSRQAFLGLDKESQAEFISQAGKEHLVDTLLTYVFRGSNIHHGAAVLLSIGAGILKKDVVFRRIVEPYDVSSLLAKTNPDLTAEEITQISSEILAKGHPYSLKGWRRMLYDWDFI